jgi:hypothetical protein
MKLRYLAQDQGKANIYMNNIKSTSIDNDKEPESKDRYTRADPQKPFHLAFGQNITILPCLLLVWVTSTSGFMILEQTHISVRYSILQKQSMELQ